MAGRQLPGLGLKGDWALGEDNWKDENDLNLLTLSVLTQGRVLAIQPLETDPPAEGDIVILDDTHATHPNAVAVYDEGSWKYITAFEGLLMWNIDDSIRYEFKGGEWAELSAGFDDAPADGETYGRKDNAWEPVAAGGGGSGGEAPKYLHVVDEKPANTNGGIPVVGWQTRTLNLVKANTLTGSSLAANDITLPAGTYYVEAAAPGYYTNRHKIRLRNVTAGTTLLNGDAAISPNDVANMAMTYSTLRGYITLAAPTVVRLEHFFQSTTASQGFGMASNSGEPEIYASMTIQKIAVASAGGGEQTDISYVAAMVEFTNPAAPVMVRSVNASVTRTAAGRYRVTFTTPFADDDYTVIGNGRFADAAADNVPAVNIDRRATRGKTNAYVDVTFAPSDGGAPTDNMTFARIAILRRKTIATGAAPATAGPEEMIANIVLGADGAFPAIDVAGFRSVRMLYNLQLTGTTTGSSPLTMRFNGDATEYYYQDGYDLDAVASGGAQAANQASGVIGVVNSASAGNARLNAGGVVNFFGLDSAKNKTWASIGEMYNYTTSKIVSRRHTGFWNKADAVTSIALLQNFAAGSTIQVLGIRRDAGVSTPNRGFDTRAAGEVTNLAVPTFVGVGIASVVKLSESIFQVNFSSPMPDTDYLVMGTAKYPNAAANQAPVFGLCRNTNLLGGAIGKQLNYVVIDTFQGNGAAAAIDTFDIMVGYPIAYTGTSRDGVLGYAYSHTKVTGVNSAAVEDIPGMSVTFTMPVDGLIELDFDIVLGRASGAVRLFIEKNGVDIVNAEAGQVAYNSIGMAEHANQILKGKQVYPLSAGNHTFKLKTSAVATTTPADYKDRSMIIRRLA